MKIRREDYDHQFISVRKRDGILKAAGYYLDQRDRGMDLFPLLFRFRNIGMQKKHVRSTYLEMGGLSCSADHKFDSGVPVLSDRTPLSLADCSVDSLPLLMLRMEMA